MIYVFLLASCIVFIELFIFLDLKAEARHLVGRSQSAIGVMMSAKYDDEEKETMVRRASVEIFKSTFLISLKFSVIALALYAMYRLVITVSPELENQILTSMISPTIIVGMTLVATAYVWARNVLFR